MRLMRSSSSTAEAASRCVSALRISPWSSSRRPRATVSGVRSSWDASDRNRFWFWKASSSRPSMPSNASARRPTSSRERRRPTRRERSPVAWMDSTCLIIPPSGLSIRRTLTNPSSIATIRPMMLARLISIVSAWPVSSARMREAATTRVPI